MATKYKQYVDRMLEAEKDLFDEFKKIHDAYSEKQDELQSAYNEKGAKVLEVLNEWENKLCSQSEKGGYGSFTPKLAEKFREEIKKHFPYIDHIGIQVSYAPVEIPSTDAFTLKRIDLS